MTHSVKVGQFSVNVMKSRLVFLECHIVNAREPGSMFYQRTEF